MLLRLLILFYLVGICAAVVASVVEIETILATGPILSLLGLIIAAVALAVGSYNSV